MTIKYNDKGNIKDCVESGCVYRYSNRPDYLIHERVVTLKKTEAQAAADKRWEEKNREYASYLKSRSSARSFIRNKATKEDLEELKQLIQERENSLQ